MTEAIMTFPAPQEPSGAEPAEQELSRQRRLSLLEAVIFAADDPPTVDQLAEGLGLPKEQLETDLSALCESYRSDLRGIEIRAVGGGYRMSTKAEHHEAVRAFVKTVRPKLRLSKAALETLAVVAYRQPVTLPEIQAIRGVVNASGVVHTLLSHKLIATAGRKKIIGRPMRYKTTPDFLLQFGLSDLNELPTLKEMEALSRAALDEDQQVAEGGDEEQDA